MQVITKLPEGRMPQDSTRPWLKGTLPDEALFVDTGNLVITLADTNKFRQGIDQLDLMAVHDIS